MNIITTQVYDNVLEQRPSAPYPNLRTLTFYYRKVVIHMSLSPINFAVYYKLSIIH